MIDRVHHVGVVLPDADAALRLYRDVMGLRVTADEVVEEQGVRGVLLECGENEIELLQPVRNDTGVARYLESRGPTLHHFCLNTTNIRGELERLKGLGVELIDQEPRRGLAGEIAFIHPRSMRGVLVELAQPPAGAHTSTAKGFDHIAVGVHDIATAAKTWRDVAGLRVTNTLGPSSGMLVGQMPCGQCIIELVAPASPDSRVAQALADRGEHAYSMIAVEVPDLSAAIAHYRAAGITLPEPQPGIIPGTMRTSIPADQAFGLGVQLIAYAR